MPHRPSRVRAAIALAATAALTTTLLATLGATPAGADVAGADPTGGEPVKTLRSTDDERAAVTAVSTARAIAEGRRGGDLTMALREVANTRTALTGSERSAADAMLARPTDDDGSDSTLEYTVPEATPSCSSDICVHYVRTTDDAPDPTDLDPVNGVPDYVDLTLATLTRVHDDFLDAGYREPKSDGTIGGGNGLIDVYLGNIGVNGLYGYCTSDDPSRSTSNYDRWAYCALDNDYSPAEFPTNTPLENLQVTVAHEYFHAVQYAYDRFEDSWLLEATAAWVEDELYDDVNDNVQYLRSSQMRSPRVPLDTFGNQGFHYGTWSFFRFLTEKFRAKKGRLPRLVLDIFAKADGAAGRPDQHSWQAIDSVLRSKRTTAATMLGQYAVANRRPAGAYSEGRANRYPTAPLFGQRSVTARRVVRAGATLDHLTTATSRFRPQGLRATNWKLRLTFDLPPRWRGSSALVTTVRKGGKVTTQKVALNKQGNGVKHVPFSSRTIAAVEVTLVNGSGRFRCFVSGAFSCQGVSKDERLPMRFVADAVR